MLRLGLLDEKRMMHLGAYIKKAMSNNGDLDKYGEGKFGAIKGEKVITPGVKSEPSNEFYNDLMSKFAEISAKEDLDKKFVPTTNMGSNISNRKGPSKWKTDPDLPEGWKWKIYRTDPARERKMLLSPDQSKFASIHSALRQLVMTEGKDEEVAIITRCLHANKHPEFTLPRFLVKDGWFTTSLLPEGYWLKQKRSERSFLSLTPNFVQLKTMKELFDHLRQDGHSEESVAIIQNNYRLWTKDALYKSYHQKIIPL